MEHKHFNPLSDLTQRDHEVLRMIARVLRTSESLQQASGPNDSGDCEDLKIAPASSTAAWKK